MDVGRLDVGRLDVSRLDVGRLDVGRLDVCCVVTVLYIQVCSEEKEGQRGPPAPQGPPALQGPPAPQGPILQLQQLRSEVSRLTHALHAKELTIR